MVRGQIIGMTEKERKREMGSGDDNIGGHSRGMVKDRREVIGD